MVQLLTNGAWPVTPYVTEGGGAHVMAHLQSTGATAANRLVRLNMRLIDGHLQWGCYNTFAAGGRWDLVGVTLGGGNKDDVVPVAIYGPVKNVTLPAAVTKSQTNPALERGGTRSNLGVGFGTGPETDDLSVATITDSKTGSANGRDLFLYGRDYMRQTLFRNTGQYREIGSKQSQSLLVDGNGPMYLWCRAPSGLTKGRLTMFRRGRDGTWHVEYKSAAPALGDAVSDGVFMYGVPAFSVTAATGAVGLVQVFGWVQTDLGVTVNIASGGGIRWTPGNNTLTPVGDYDDYRTFAVPESSGSGRNRKMALMGRVWSN